MGFPTLQVGWTPIAEFPAFARTLGVAALHIKDDGRSPTGSFKDRSSAVAVVRAKEQGFTTIACASSGNAACSLAGFAANLGLRAIIFVPATAPPAKVAQLRAFGARVLLVRGTYEQAFLLCEEAVRRFGWYDRNCAVNPYLVEGKKTCGLELGEQLADTPPDWVSVAVGDGCTIAGVWKGLRHMHELGVLPRLPRLLGVQAEGAAALVAAFAAPGEQLRPVDAVTCADSICVGHPHNWRKALRAVRESGGAMIAVSDRAILEATRDLPAATGIFAEPTAAASIAGIRAARAHGLIDATARVAVVITGNGLKDITGVQLAPPAIAIEPTLDAVRDACD